MDVESSSIRKLCSKNLVW